MMKLFKKEVIEEKDPRTLNEKVDDLLRYFEVAKKSKKIREKDLPVNVRNAKSLIKKKRIMGLVLRTNGAIEAKRLDIANGMIKVEDKYFDGSPKFVWFWKGKIPTYLLPEWDLQPIGRDKMYKEAKDKDTLNYAQTIILRAMKQEQAGMKMQMGGKMWIWVIIGAAAVLYFLFGGQA